MDAVNIYDDLIEKVKTPPEDLATSSSRYMRRNILLVKLAASS